MKFISLGILLFLSILCVQPASAKQAETIDELAEMYSIDKCAACHEKQYNEWKTSSMGNSVIDPRVLRGWRTFIRLALDEEASLARKDLRICLNCHVPQIEDGTDRLVEQIAELVLTAVEHELPAERDAATAKLSRLTLNCLGCHNLRGTGFGSQPAENTIYVPDHVDGSAHKAAGYKTVQTDLFSKADFCAQCHHCPPGVPWEECPTLYTTHIDDFVEHGRTETCQECHMRGKERSHKFFGPQDQDFLTSSVSLSLNARSSRYIDIYENKKLHAVVINVSLANNAGHTIPHGCAIMPRMVMDVTVNDQDGREIFSSHKNYSVNDLYFKGGKQVAMAEWDVTATEHYDLGLKSIETDRNTFIVPVPEETHSVDITATVKYLYSRDQTFPMAEGHKHVIIEYAR